MEMEGKQHIPQKSAHCCNREQNGVVCHNLSVGFCCRVVMLADRFRASQPDGEMWKTDG